MQRIEIRNAAPAAWWPAIAAEELGGHAALARHVLAAGESLPASGGMDHVWVAAGTVGLDTPLSPALLAAGDLVLPAAGARLVAGAEGAMAWVASVPGEPPATTQVVRPHEGEAAILAGDLYTVKRRAADTDGHLGILHFAIPPGGGPIPHIHHHEDEVFVVLEGLLSLYADGLRTHAAPGDVVCLPRGLPHGFHNLTDAPAAMLCLLAPGGGEQFFLDAGRPGEAPRPDPAEIARILAVAERYGVEMRPDIPDPYLPWPGGRP